jgi:hypothetical protein
LAKAKLQNYLAAAACNVKRWLRRVAWKMEQEEQFRLRSSRRKTLLKNPTRFTGITIIG